uniref:Calmodulin n=1 Tax=Zooxanthella nutricula TaxID=1333877 RepID=A0A7S2Q6P1_9DINO
MGAARSSHAQHGVTGPEFTDLVKRARTRLGTLPVQGRYHRLPNRLEDSYIVERKTLGTGSSGPVLAAKRRHTAERYAVKKIFLEGDDARKVLASEVEIILSLDHPNVVRLFEVYESESALSLVMECMEGGTLYSRVSEVKVFPESDAVMTTLHMLRAVNYIHSEGIAHRDLKLENFMYDKSGSNFLKLIDFGFSKVFEKNNAMEESLGTVTYVAPEVVGKKYTRGSCDLWSMGVIVFILLGGYMPFAGKDDQAILRAVLRGKYRMHESRWGKVSREGRDFVERLLVVDPRRRMTAKEALAHTWISRAKSASDTALLPGLEVGQAFVRFAEASRFRQACMHMMAWSTFSVPHEERTRYRHTFLALDTTHRGVVKLNDLRAFLERGGALPEDDLALVMGAAERVESACCTGLRFADFIAVMMAPRLAANGDRVLHDAFARFDDSHRGWVTEGQIRETLGSKVSRAEIAETFQRMDINSDGRVSLKEFLSYVRDVPAGLVELRAIGSGVSGSTFAGSSDSPLPNLLGRSSLMRRAASRIACAGGCFTVSSRQSDFPQDVPKAAVRSS